MSQHASIAIQDISLHHVKTACSNCSLRELCLPFGLTQEEMIQLETIISQRNRRIKKGDALYRAGAPLYAVRLGFFKMLAQSEDGHEQITGFQMAGELMGKPNALLIGLARIKRLNENPNRSQDT